ncbi:hypothetical protein BDZ90DRAFT_229148 [Jaminaea rosea]|uniref:Exocyst complex protein EXO70 n=1 Tax=Jaminaea rosea TaxID=1569628 RepID=A0A316V0P4_9BASI|nr:hypothetical protein BDZ90DRAFT_229148 [Jaminaea rosea]PWN30121.1 hypothetical protein BDZ90DRAFT_229148 [Jaminaea rosea]
MTLGLAPRVGRRTESNTGSEVERLCLTNIVTKPYHQSSDQRCSPESTSTMSVSWQDNDDALAELELLAQNQRKLNQLTQRMTGILSGFDRRLASLEGTLLPIHHRTQTLNRVEKNVEATLEALQHTLGHFNVVDEEEPKILKGPDVHNVSSYLDTIDRLVRGLEYLKRSDLKSQEGVVRRMHDLIETGSRNLTTLLEEWVSAESVPISPEDYGPRGLPLPILSGSTLEAIIPIFSRLKTLPTNPSNGYAPFLAALSLYSDLRGSYLEQSIAPLGKRLVDFATDRVGNSNASRGAMMTAAFDAEGEDEGAYQRGSAGAKEWLAAILDLAENEHAILTNLLRGLTPPSSSSTIASTFSRLLRPVLRHFTATVTALQSHVRRNMSTHTLFSLDLIGALSDAQMRWNSVIVNAAGKGGGGNEDGIASSSDGSGAHALGEQLQSLRTSTMNVFIGFLNDVQSLPRQRESEVPSTNINEITYLCLTFLRQMCDYADVVAPLLATLGAGNWMMSSNTAPVLSLSINPGDQRGILSQYLCDTLATVLEALRARSRAIKQPSTASIFLLNNIGRLQRDLSMTSILSDYLGATGTELLQRSMGDARNAYLDAWRSVVSALQEDSGDGPGATTDNTSAKSQKEDAKQRFARFFEGLEDLERLHLAYPLSRDDDELRRGLRREVVSHMVLPAYRRFVARQMAAQFSSNPSKHMRPEGEVEDRLLRLFA